MLGAIAGDIIGSVYEACPTKRIDFPLFQPHSSYTDDTVLTIAIAYALLRKVDYATSLKTFGRRYPNAGYGAFFYNWIFTPESPPYNSWGNGAAMRVSPIGFAFDSLKEISQRFAYDLNRTLDEIRPSYHFDVSCQGSVPEAVIAFLESESYEDAVRKAISLGGDSDTLACITGGIAHAFYKDIPQEIVFNVRQRLPEEFLRIVDDFNAAYGLSS